MDTTMSLLLQKIRTSLMVFCNTETKQQLKLNSSNQHSLEHNMSKRSGFKRCKGLGLKGLKSLVLEHILSKSFGFKRSGF